MTATILQGGHAALVGALRREEAASRSIKRLEGELEGVRDVLRQRDMDAQRTKMIIRLKEDKIARLQARPPKAPARGTVVLHFAGADGHADGRLALVL